MYIFTFYEPYKSKTRQQKIAASFIFLYSYTVKN
jgi:hypothetical protein